MRTVVAVVVKDGLVVSYATNEHKEKCKREGFPTGVGYELCEWCNYPNHAEYKAVQGIENATCFLVGHTYACEPCKAELAQRNVELVIVENSLTTTKQE